MGPSLRSLPSPVVPLPLLGLLGALAFAVDDAHQSWSALYLDDELGPGPCHRRRRPRRLRGPWSPSRAWLPPAAVRFPTLLGVLSARVDDDVRATATSVVTTVAYLGFRRRAGRNPRVAGRRDAAPDRSGSRPWGPAAGVGSHDAGRPRRRACRAGP